MNTNTHIQINTDIDTVSEIPLSADSCIIIFSCYDIIAILSTPYFFLRKVNSISKRIYLATSVCSLREVPFRVKQV